MESLSEKLALVTGAAGVVGLAVSEALVEDGLKVIMVDLNAERLAELAGGLGANAIPLALDISDAQAVAAAWAGIKRDHGAVQVLVNNAGGPLDRRYVRPVPPAPGVMPGFPSLTPLRHGRLWRQSQ